MHAVIVSTGHFLPERIVTSEEMERRVAEASPGVTVPPGLIEAASGVSQRRMVEPGTVSSDLATAAGLAALRNADLDPMAIDLMIFASASHDVSEPATSAIVQDKIGCRNATFVDVKNACNSFVNAMDFAAAMIATGRATRVLITSGEVLSPTINYALPGLAEVSRRFAAFTIGDVGAAMVLEASEDDSRGLLPARFTADGSHWRLSTVLFGGTLMGRDDSRWYFEADSAALQNLALSTLPELLTKTAADIGWTPEDLAFVVPHQVSWSIIEGLASALDFPTERCLLSLDMFGNTAAASIPLALSLADEQGRIARGDKVLIIGGAAGFSAAALPVIW
jgi:3-oxoacyl-[acyl-carrier-protein] synthase-3